MHVERRDTGGRRTIVLTIVLGLASGVVGSLGVNLLLGRQPASGPTAEEARQRAEVARTPTNDPSKFLAAAAALKAASARADRSEPRSPAVPPPPEDGRVLFRSFVAAHEREAPDPSWATKTKKGLTHDLQGLEKIAHFSRFQLDCRSKTCKGEIE